MSSSIDATKPATGVPAVKDDLRANLAAAKTELNHGGFFTQVGAANSFTGQLERTSESRLNDLSISVRDYGAVGDDTSRPVSQWLTGGARDRGYANLAAIQVDYPHVTSTSDTIDWAAIQKAINVGIQVAGKESRRVVIPAGNYHLNKTVIIDRNVELVGEGMSATFLKWTAAHTSGPLVALKPTPLAATINWAAVRDMLIDGTLVPTTNVTNHGIEFYNNVQSEVRRVCIYRPKGCGILMQQSFFCVFDNITIDRPDDSAICLRNGITASTDAYGDGGLCCNGNHFTNIFYQANYGPNPGPFMRPRFIEILQPSECNFFTELQVQTATYRLDDCFIFQGGTQNYIGNVSTYDGPGVSRTFTTSSGAGGVIRATFAHLPNLVTGSKITATGVTGMTPGTLYTLTVVNEWQFDVTGTTYSGSSQTGRMVRGGNITATADGGGEDRIQITSAEHGLWTGQVITVAGITGGTGTQAVIRVDRNTFQLAGTTFSGGSQTGTWTIDRPTSLIQFGDPGNGDGNSGLKSIFENFRIVMGHDPATKVYCALFTGWARQNVVGKCFQDQGGSCMPYLVEGGTVENRMREWSGVTVTDGSDKLIAFEGGNIDYSARLMARDFGIFTPVIGDMIDEQVAFGTSSGVGKLYYRKGGTIYVFSSGGTIT